MRCVVRRDGSVKPFATGALVFAIGACAAVWLTGRPPVDDMGIELVVEGDAVPALVD